MKKIFFVYPSPIKTNPRGIRVDNIVKNLKLIAPENKYHILGFANSIKSDDDGVKKVNKFNLIYLIIRYLGFFKIGSHFSIVSKTLDPLMFTHFLIKWDLKNRIDSSSSDDKLVFVIMISPFSNYLLVPYLKKNYPYSKIICDIGDPLYKNAARWNNDDFSKSIEMKSVRISDYIIVTNQLTKNHFVKEYSYPSQNIIVIEQGVDVELIQKFLKNAKINSNTLVYAGRFYKDLRSPNELFKAISKQNKFTLNVYGNNDVKLADNVKYKGLLPQDKLFSKMAEHEILIFIENKGSIQTSGKIFELLAFDKPILYIRGGEESETFRLLKKHPKIHFCQNESNSILNALCDISTQKSVNIQTENLHQISWLDRSKKYIEVINL